MNEIPLKLESWGLNKNFYVRILSQNAAIFASDIYGILLDAKNNKHPKNFAEPSITGWKKFYYDRKRLQRKYLSGYLKVGGILAFHAQVIGTITNTLPTTASTGDIKEKENVREGTIEDVLRMHFSTIREDIANKPISDSQREEYIKLFLHSDFLFIMKIVLPCWLLYGKDHVRLYRRATLGNVNALDELLRLDKIQIQNPRINKWFHHFSKKKQKHKLNTLLKALREPPKQKITPKKVKYMVAGYISVVSELCSERLTAPEIQDLFDAVAIDYHIDELRDCDLPDSPETFSKAVQRERDFWIKAFHISGQK